MVDDQSNGKILGDINPVKGREKKPGPSGDASKDETTHAGSRDVTDGTTVGTEVGGTRNYRQGSGATGSDIGNRPE